MSMERILQLKEERANLTTQMRGIYDAHPNYSEMPGEKLDELRKIEGQFDKLNERILGEEKQLERERLAGEASSRRIDGKGEDERGDEKAAQVKNAFIGYLRAGTDHAMSQYRALQQDNPTQAGYLVAPQQFMAEIIQDKNNLTFMRQIANVLPAMEKAQSLGFPKKTSRMSTFAWGTEIQAPTADTAMAFGKREFMPKPATGGILVSKTLARNSAVDIEAYVKAEMAYNAATNEEQAFMTGNGSGQPLGIFTASDNGISTARDVSTGNTATEIKFDGLFEAKYSIKEQYQANLSWIFNRLAVKQIAKVKDAEGQYIWQQSVSLNTPDMLMGKPVKMSEYAPSTFTSGQYVGVLGDIKAGYWIADSLTLEMQALLELYALTNQIYFIGRHEVDGMPVLEEAFARVKLG